MRFAGQHVLITGGSSGIGKACAVHLAQMGARISILARDREKLARARAEIAADVVAVSADVADRAQVDAAIAAAVAQAGPVDVLIASAGMAHPGYFHALPVEVFERSMAVNYFGSLYALQAVLPSMLERREGYAVLISSGAGLIGLYGYTPYAPTKFALRGLAESLRGELKGTGVGLSIAYPPDTDTPQLEEENKTKPPETKAMTGTARMWSAEGVAEAIVQGIQKDRFVIAPGLEMTWLARLHSALAPCLNWYFDRLAAKVKGKR